MVSCAETWGILVIVMDCVLVTAVIGGCVECKCTHGMKNIKVYPIFRKANFDILTKYLSNFLFNFILSAVHTNSKFFPLLRKS